MTKQQCKHMQIENRKQKIEQKSKLNKTGDVKVYSKQEWQNMLGNTGFINIKIEKIKGFFLIITAEFAK